MRVPEYRSRPSAATQFTHMQEEEEPLPARIYSPSLGLTIRTRDTAAEAAQDNGYSSSSDDSDAEFTNLSKDQKDKPAPKYTIIIADVLIPGASSPLNNHALVIADEIITWIGPSNAVPSSYTSSTPPSRIHRVPVAMPGLWDVHVHLDGITDDEDLSDPVAIISTHPAVSGARLARGCWEALQRGYTSMRDLAGLGCEMAKVINDGSIVGPNIYAAGACLSQTGGHGDLFQLPAGHTQLDLGVRNGISAGTQYAGGHSILVDGVDDCRKGVRLQIRRGAKCIKVMASGGVGSRDDDVYCAQFSPEELKVIVEEAGRQDVSVAAHVHSKRGIMAAVEAGVRSVEHVSLADQECLDAIREKKVVYVATRTVNDILKQTKGKGLPKSVWEKAKKMNGANLAAYKAAIADGGIDFALGTDTAPGFNMAIELDHAVRAGMTNLQAIKAATANGPLVLGAKAPLSGQLKVGYEADILGVMANPVDDVKVLQKKSNIAYVWKGGKLFKGPGVGPWGDDS